MAHDGKSFIVTAAAWGMGPENLRILKARGARASAMDRDESDVLIHGLANIAGVPPADSAAVVMRINLVGLHRPTVGLAPKLADGASIVNLASLAGIRCDGQIEPGRGSGRRRWRVGLERRARGMDHPAPLARLGALGTS